MEGRRPHLAGALAFTLLLASCGGGERQDADEPSGRYRVDVTRAEFPAEQSLAKRSSILITVRNLERKRTVPNVNVTLHGLTRRSGEEDLADSARPVFIVNGKPKELGALPETKEAAPGGSQTAYVDTWALGRLGPGKAKTFRWDVTAVKPGPYRLSWRVQAGLDGQAKAIAAAGGAPSGLFSGTISDVAPDVRVGDDGRSIIQGTR